MPFGFDLVGLLCWFTVCWMAFWLFSSGSVNSVVMDTNTHPLFVRFLISCLFC